MNIFLFLSGVFLFTFLAGRVLQTLRIPWIFSALLLGGIFAIYNPFSLITNSESFTFLSNLGMYFLLFIIGFEINLKQISEKRAFIMKTAFVVIFSNTLFGSLFIHYVFDYNWLISVIVALSFSTVGEAILVPILDEFNITKSSLGQTILSVGTFDDVLEILTLVFVILFVGAGIHGQLSILIISMSLLVLFLMTFGLSRLKTQGERFSYLKIEPLFLFVIATMFLFIGVGEYAEASALGAVLAGIGLRTFIPDERLEAIENDVKAVCYGIFAPIFFFWVGLGLNIDYLLENYFLVILTIIISSGAKFLATILFCRKELGMVNSLLLSTGLSVRFSTSIVVMKILYDNGIVADNLYSVIIASSIILTFIVPIVLSQLLKEHFSEVY